MNDDYGKIGLKTYWTCSESADNPRCRLLRQTT